MKLNELLVVYENMIDASWARQKRTHKNESKYRDGLLGLYKKIKYYCDDYNESIAMRKPTNEEINELRYHDKEYDLSLDVDFVIDYRGVKIPIYTDDYGQQLFTIIGDKDYGFGAYNTDASEACDIYDDYIDKKKR